MADLTNDIKILFFIVNSLNGLLSGLVTFAIGVALGAQSGMREYQFRIRYNPAPMIACVVIGLITLAVAALGYAGAIRKNRIMLFIYTGIMVLAIVVDIAGAALMDPNSYINLASIITHLGLTVLAAILAVILAVKIRKHTNQGMILSPPPAAYTPVA